MLTSNVLLRSLRRSLQHVRPTSFKVGDSASLTKAFSEKDVEDFARISLDANPMHIDVEAGRQSIFGQRVVHGVLTLGLLSAVMAQKIPGEGCILMDMNFKCPAPLYIDEEVTAQVTVTEIKGRKMTLHMLCSGTDNKVVIEGGVTVLAPKEKAADAL